VFTARVRRTTEAELRKTHPLSGLVEGWFFRYDEASAGCYVAEGRDLWGRRVSRKGAENAGVLEACVADARAIAAQLPE
jgi:hypothetical protein